MSIQGRHGISVARIALTVTALSGAILATVLPDEATVALFYCTTCTVGQGGVTSPAAASMAS